MRVGKLYRINNVKKHKSVNAMDTNSTRYFRSRLKMPIILLQTNRTSLEPQPIVQFAIDYHSINHISYACFEFCAANNCHLLVISMLFY